MAARAQERADAFGDEFDIPHRYDDYAQLVADPDVDVGLPLAERGAVERAHGETTTIDFEVGGEYDAGINIEDELTRWPPTGRPIGIVVEQIPIDANCAVGIKTFVAN